MDIAAVVKKLDSVRDSYLYRVNRVAPHLRTFADWLFGRREVVCLECTERNVRTCQIARDIGASPRWRDIEWCPRCGGHCVQTTRNDKGLDVRVYAESQSILAVTEDGLHTMAGRCDCVAAKYQYGGLKVGVKSTDTACLVELSERDTRLRAAVLARNRAGGDNE